MQCRGGSAVCMRGWQGHTCRQGPVQATWWWLSDCVLGAVRGGFTLGVWGLRRLYSWQPAQTPTSIYNDKSCRSMCKIHTCTSTSLCLSTPQQAGMPTHIDPWHQMPPQPQHVNASCDATLQPYYCGRSLSLAPQHNYSPDEWFGNDRQLELQTVWYWGVHFLPAWVPEV